jgi:hypothetical protein
VLDQGRPLHAASDKKLPSFLGHIFNSFAPKSSHSLVALPYVSLHNWLLSTSGQLLFLPRHDGEGKLTSLLP